MLSCAQWGAKGARAFFCVPFKLCQGEVEAGEPEGEPEGEAGRLIALACEACANAPVTAVHKTTARQMNLKR